MSKITREFDHTDLSIDLTGAEWDALTPAERTERDKAFIEQCINTVTAALGGSPHWQALRYLWPRYAVCRRACDFSGNYDLPEYYEARALEAALRALLGGDVRPSELLTTALHYPGDPEDLL